MRLLPVLALCALPLPALAQTPEEQAEDRGFLTGLIEDALSSTARQVRIEGFEGALSTRATIDRLTIADGEGIWLEATDLALDWNRSALLAGRIDIEELSAGTIEVLRAPVPDPAAPTPEATPFRLPDLPVSVDIAELDADRIVLSEDLLGEEIVLTLEGSVDLEGGEGTANLSAEIVEGSEGSLDFAGSYSNETRILSVDLDLQEAEGGLAARALKIPGLPSVALHIDGTAPIDDYEANLSLATAGEPRVTGTFALKTTGEGEVVARAFGLDLRGDLTPLLAPDTAAFLGEDLRLRTKGIRRADGSLVLTSLGIEGESVALSGRAEITPEGWPARFDLSGEVGKEGGEPVPLPGANELTVRHVELDLSYDRSEGEDWTGTFAVDGLAAPGASVDALTLEGGGTIEPATAASPGRFTAGLDYAARGLAFEAEGVGEALGADLTGHVDLVRPEDGGPLQVRSLTLSGPGIEALAEGTVAGADQRFETKSSISIEAQDLARFAELTGLDLGGSAEATIVSALRPLDGVFDLALSGTTEDLELGIERLDPLLAGDGAVTLVASRDESGLRVETLDLSTGAIAASGEADLTSGASEARFDLSLTDLGLAFPDLAGPATLSGTFSREASGEAALVADATLPGAQVTLDATQGPSTLDADGDAVSGPVTFEARAEAAELSRYRDLLATLAPELGLAPSGALDLTLSGTAEPDLDRFDVTVAADTQDLALGIAPLDAALAGEGSLSGRIQRTGLDALHIEDLAIETDLLSGTVTADLTEDGGTARLDLALANVEPVLGGLSGPGRVAGTAMRLPDGGFDLDLDATLPTGTASLDGTLAPPEQGSAFTGDIVADFADIAPLGPLLGRELGGALRADVAGTLRPDLSVLDLTFDATTRDLRLGIPRLDPLLAGPGTFSGQIERSPDSGLALAVTADAPLLKGEAAGTFMEDSGQGSFDLTLPDVSVIAPGLSGPASATGTATRAPDGTIDVNAQAAAPGASATIDASIAPPDQGYEIAGTARVSAENLAPFSALAGRPLSGALDATVTGSALPSLERFDLTLDATTRDLSLGDPTLARLLAGTGTASAHLLRDAGGPIRAERLTATFPNLSVTAQGTPEGASFDARLADLGLFVPEFPGPVTATGTASFAGAAATVDSQVSGPGAISAQVTGTLAPSLDLRLVGTAPLALANAILEPRRFAGPASFELRLTGTSLDALSGTVTVQDARVADPTLGEAVTDIDGTATIANGTATVDLTGALATGGRLAATGTVALAPPFDANLSVAGTGLVVRDPSLYEAFGDARLTVAGPLAGGALIAGVVNLDAVEMRVPSSGAGALGELPRVFHIEPSLPVLRTLERADLSPDGTEAGVAGDGAEGGGRAFALDILLNAPSRVFIRGRGLDAELGGTLRLTGTTRDIVPIGQFSLLRGRLDILGQRFELTEGSATLQGSFDPYIRLVAQTEARTGTDITITLEGPLSSPDVTFASQPELPEDEVLAQLLFGVDIASITPLQAVRLAAAVAELAGGGTGLVSDLRGQAGLADFDVTTTESGSLALRLGQYITENVYTDVIVSPEETEVTINLDLTPDLTVRAAVSTEGETTLGIYYEKDY